MPTKRWLATAMLVLLVGCMECVEDEEQPRKVVLPEVFITAASPPETIDPGIRLRELRDPLGTIVWQITNTQDVPVTIHRVVFNGELDPPIAEGQQYSAVEEFYIPSRQTFPRTLTIGDTCVLYKAGSYEGQEGYRKEIIYIDLYTDRGNFRYRPLEGFEALADSPRDRR